MIPVPPVSAVVFALILLLPAPVRAAEAIRVLLLTDAPRVVLSAERGVMIQLPTGEERVLMAPLAVTPLLGGLTINEQAVRAGRIRVTGWDGDLTVSTGAGPDSTPLVVSGTVHVVNRGKGLALINEVDLEEYVKGVVPAEMNAAWHPEALKVQAVITRTYALYQRMASLGREYDLAAGTQDQVYRGRQGVDARVQQAVEATRGLVLTHRNAPILAAFSSTAAGPTEDAMTVWSKDLPYLKGVDCPFDLNSPYYQWRVQIRLEDLEAGLRRQGLAVGTIATVTPFAYSRAGRVARIRILHSDGELILRGEDLRRAAGYTVIPSTQFEVEAVGREIVLSGRGAGHAVGLCQWGAKELAELGYSFATILHYYFPGTDLKAARFTDLVFPFTP